MAGCLMIVMKMLISPRRGFTDREHILIQQLIIVLIIQSVLNRYYHCSADAFEPRIAVSDYIILVYYLTLQELTVEPPLLPSTDKFYIPFLAESEIFESFAIHLLFFISFNFSNISLLNLCTYFLSIKYHLTTRIR